MELDLVYFRVVNLKVEYLFCYLKSDWNIFIIIGNSHNMQHKPPNIV